MYGITGDIFGAMLSGAGAVIPDVIEGKSFNAAIHRRMSHWFFPYAAVLLVAAYYLLLSDGNGGTVLSHFVSAKAPLHPPLMIALTCQFMCIGALLHICEDAFCGKVPLFNPRRKDVGIRFFITGSGKEYGITALIMFLSIAGRYFL